MDELSDEDRRLAADLGLTLSPEEAKIEREIRKGLSRGTKNHAAMLVR